MEAALPTLKAKATVFRTTAKTRLCRPIWVQYLMFFDNFENFVWADATTNQQKVKTMRKQRILVADAEYLDILYQMLKTGYTEAGDNKQQVQRVVSLLFTAMYHGVPAALDLDTVMALEALVKDVHTSIKTYLKDKTVQDAGGAVRPMDFEDAEADFTKFGATPDQATFIGAFKDKVKAIMMHIALAFQATEPFKNEVDVSDKTDISLYRLLDQKALKVAVVQQFQTIVAVTANDSNTVTAPDANDDFWSQEAKMDAPQPVRQGNPLDNALPDPNPQQMANPLDTALQNPLDNVMQSVAANDPRDPTKKSVLKMGMRKLCESGGIWTKTHIRLIGEVLLNLADDYSDQVLQQALADVIRMDPQPWTKSHIEMLKVVIADPRLTRGTLQRLVDEHLKACKAGEAKGVLPLDLQKIYNNAKSHGAGGMQLRFHTNAADGAFRALLDKYLNPKMTARFVDRAMRKQTSALNDVLKGDERFNEYGMLELLTTS